MPYIKVSPSALSSMSETLRNSSSKVGRIESDFASVGRKLDWDIRSASDIRKRIDRIDDELVCYIAALKKMELFLVSANEKYSKNNDLLIETELEVPGVPQSNATQVELDSATEKETRAKQANAAKWITTGVCILAGIAVTVATGGAALPVIITGAVTGGAIATVNSAADQYVEEDWNGIDWGEVAKDGCVGLATGAVTSAIGTGVGNVVTSKVLGSASGQLVQSGGKALQIGVHAVSSSVGEVAGGITARASGEIVQDVLENGEIDWEQVSQEAFSVQRIAMDASLGFVSGGVAEYSSIRSRQLVVSNPDFLDDAGRIRWTELAPNGGCVPDTSVETTLPVGTMIDRYGDSFGRYISPQGVPYSQRALPYVENPNALHCYQVVKPIGNVTQSTIAPAFDQPGGGIQYTLPDMVHELIRKGYLKEVRL